MRRIIAIHPTILGSALIGISIAASAAHAQFTTYVQPNPIGGGYTVQTPGASPYTTYVQPNPIGGGYTVQTPGAPFNQRY